MDAYRKLQHLKTLLVEDDPFIRDAMQLAFKQKQIGLRIVETAEEGLKALSEEPFDIIVCDFKLPGLDGLGFLKQAAALQSDTIKVLISAHGDHDIVAAAYAVGVQDFLQKPFKLKTLWATLAMHVSKRNGQGQVVELGSHPTTHRKHLESAAAKRKESAVHGDTS
jgi:DNA-binding NtrC family response regulator